MSGAAHRHEAEDAFREHLNNKCNGCPPRKND